LPVSGEPGPAQLYRRILATLRAEALPLLTVAAIVFVPLSLLEAVGDQELEIDLEDLTVLEIGGLTIAALLQVGTSLVGEVFYAGVVAALIVEKRTGIRRRLSDVARELPYLRLVSVDLLYSVGVAVFFVLLIVPGVLFFTYYALTAPIVEIEDRRIRAAFRRSRELVRGHFWTVLAILLPVSTAIELFTEADQAAVNALLGDSLLSDWLGTSIVNIALTPIYAVAAVVLTIELIEAKGDRLPARSPAPQ
jgi:hypothetical protein